MRPRRQDFPGARHHVMNRGARRAPVFFGHASRRLFLSILGTLPERYGVRVHGYALMPNHFHLLVESSGQLGRAMRHLCGRYVQAVNAWNGWDGPLFRGRYRNKLVDSDAYWSHLLLYVHLNPDRARLPSQLATWTSHRAYIGEVATPDWLTTRELLTSFGGPARYCAAFDDLAAGERQPPAGFKPESLWAPGETGVLHEPRFVEQYAATDALQDVLAVTSGDLADVLTSRPGRPNRSRWLLAWWMSRRRIGHGQIRALLGVSHSNVTRMVQRVERRRNQDSELERWAAALEGRRKVRPEST